jgi:NTE family protein
MASTNRSRAQLPDVDLMIRPVNVGVGFFEFHQIDAARAAGRAAARHALEVSERLMRDG